MNKDYSRDMITESGKNETLERLIALRSSIERRIADLEQLEQTSEDEEGTARIYDSRMYLIIAFENIVLGIKGLLG